MSDTDNGTTTLISRSAAWRRWQMLSFDEPATVEVEPEPEPDPGPDPEAELERDFLGQQGFDLGAAPDLADPARDWEEHAEQVVDIVDRDGVAAREYDGFFGPTTLGATMADFYGWDLLIHGSDLARASGRTVRP